LNPNNEKIGIWLDDNAAVKRCEFWYMAGKSEHEMKRNNGGLVRGKK
jgi:hypothetical protein